MKEMTTHRHIPCHRHGHYHHHRRHRHHLPCGTHHRHPFATCLGDGADRMTLHSIPCKPHHKARKNHKVDPRPEVVRSECQASARCILTSISCSRSALAQQAPNIYFTKNLNLLGAYHWRRRRTEAPHYEHSESMKHMVDKLMRRSPRHLCLCP